MVYIHTFYSVCVGCVCVDKKEISKGCWCKSKIMVRDDGGTGRDLNRESRHGM